MCLHVVYKTLEDFFSTTLVKNYYRHVGNSSFSFPGMQVPPLRQVLMLHSKASVKRKHKGRKLNLVEFIAK